MRIKDTPIAGKLPKKNKEGFPKAIAAPMGLSEWKCSDGKVYLDSRFAKAHEEDISVLDESKILSTDLPDANECCELDVEQVSELVWDTIQVTLQKSFVSDDGAEEIENILQGLDINKALAQVLAKSGRIRWRKK